VLTLLSLGYELVKKTADRIVYVRYDSPENTVPKYKQTCRKVIFDLHTESVQLKERSEKGNLTCPQMNRLELYAIYKLCVELWGKYDN